MTKQGQCKIDRSNQTAKTPGILVNTRVCSVEQFKVDQKYPKTGKILKLFERTTKPEVLKDLKKSWEVMEFEERKRVRTL